jgi:DNA polymerase III subunit gamma/tau
MTKQPYLNIARRFRPQTFSNLLGQDSLKETLKNALVHNKLASAYIFSGCRGTGKTTLARLFAKAINCSDKKDGFEPCNSCSSCKEISSSSSFEVIEIDGASNRGIDDIRNIHENLGFQTKNDTSKIYIIDEVHMLTKEAFNALLKTLEEPASNTRFFFATTEIHKIPATILSRCQKFELMRIEPTIIVDKLRSIAKELDVQTEDTALDLIAKLSEGSLRDAESLLDQMICFSLNNVTAKSVHEALGLIKLELFKELDDAYKAREPAKAFALAETFFASGMDPSVCLQQLIEHYRNCTLFKTSQQHLIVAKTPEMIETYTKAVQIYSKESLFYLLEYLTTRLESLTSHTFTKLHLEMILCHIIQSSKRVRIESIIQKVQDLKSISSTTNAVKVEISPPKIEPQIQVQNKEPIDKTKLSSDETILQFASVELNARLKKH